MYTIQQIIFALSKSSWLHQANSHDDLFIKKDSQGNNSDFFYYKFESELQSADYYEWLYNEIKEFKMQKWLLKDESSFSKNFNMIIFYCLDDMDLKISESTQKTIYWIEKNPYHSNKFVIPYKNCQIQDISWNELFDISQNFSKLQEVFGEFEKQQTNPILWWTKQKFIIDVLSSLHFLKVDYLVDTLQDNWDIDIYKWALWKIDTEMRKGLSNNSYDFIDQNFWIIEEINGNENTLSAFEKQMKILWSGIFTDTSFLIEDTFEEYLKNNQNINNHESI
jgi:hypothetical protein